MLNRNQPFALTVLSPIAGGSSEGATHAAAIRRILGTLRSGGASRLARIPTLHFARWVVIDDVKSQGHPAREEHLRSKYLLFVADFDGELPTFLDHLLAEAGDVVHSLWCHCVGFPGVESETAFFHYIERCQLTIQLSLGAYPDSPLPAVLKALDVQRMMIGFIESNQGKPAADLQRAFRDFMHEVRGASVPAGGWA